MIRKPIWCLMEFNRVVCSLSGACRSSLRRSPRAQLLLGGRRLHIQILRGDPDRHLPQGHQTQPRHAMDHKGCAQAQGNAWAHVSRQEEPWSGQGPQVPPHHRWFSPCGLEETQHSAAAPLPLKCVSHVCTLIRIKYLSLVTLHPGVFFLHCESFVVELLLYVWSFFQQVNPDSFTKLLTRVLISQ